METGLTENNKRASPEGSSDEVRRVIHLRRQLITLLRESVTNNRLEEQDVCILSLRMGLEDGTCYSLNATAHMLHKSPEAIRRRQYFVLKKNMRDLRFFKLLRDYAHLVKLPRGITYYLYRYGDDNDTF
jgi:hypothetical protein